MRRTALAIVLVCALPSLAWAQDAEPAAEPEQAGFWHRLEFSGSAGAAAVKNVGGAFGGGLSLPLTDRLDLVGEGLWIEDAVTRHRTERAAVVRSYLEDLQGTAVSASVTAPATFGGGGVRVALRTRGAVRPYASFTAGAAHVAYRPAFTIGGRNIAGVLPDYGVTLGRDLTGDLTKLALSAGGGVRFPRGRWTIDAGVRLVSIRTPDRPTNVVCARGALGLRF